jgi:hypothetical protein
MPRKKKAAIDRMPAGATKKLPHARLAEGEHTGHFHEAIGPEVALYETASPGTLLLSVPSGATVTHQEHRPVTLPPGEYERRIVLEYDHLLEESRVVVD